MFLKKSLLFMTALALLMFAGQASAQSVSLSHVPGEDGTEGTVSGSGTAIMVKVTTMGIAGNPLLASVSALDVAFAFDTSLVSLTGVPAGLLEADTATGATLTIPAPPGGTLAVPDEAILTFTTASDVTGTEFSIGITGAQGTAVVGGAVQMVPLPISASVTFNDIELIISLTSGGESVVNKVEAGDEIVVDVAIPALVGQSAGAKIVFAVDPAGSAAITGEMPADGLNIVPSETSGMQVVVAGLPMMLADGNFGSVTFTALPGVARTTSFSISVASMSVFTTAGEVAGDPGDPLMINQFSPFLEASATEVTVPHGETVMATVTAMDTEDEAVTFSVTVDGNVTAEESDTAVTLSATGDGTATVSAMAGGVALDPVTVVFSKPPPELQTESTTVMFEDFGATASATVTAAGFDEGANIRFKITGGTGFATADGAATWMVSTDRAGDVTMVAEDDMGNATAPLTISFVNPDPYLTADNADVIIPEDGEASVTVMATGLGADVSWTVSEVTGTATVNIDTDGATATLTAVDSDDLSETSTMTLVASDGSMTATTTITFRAMPSVATDMADVEVPQAVVPDGSSMVMAVNFPDGAEITFNVEVVSGSESDLSQSQDGAVLTLTATGSVTVSVTASGAGVTTSAVTVTFTQDMPAAPGSVVVQDQEGDNGHYVMVSFAHSANHADVSQYRVYREMMVNTATDDDGNVVPGESMAKWVPWAVIDAMDNDEGMTRAVVPVTDATATRWGVAAESGMDSGEITPAGKRVFSKESVQHLVQFLGVDPNLVVTEDELAQMFMPSADYIKSLIGDQKNVVFAALDPDVSVLIGGDVAVPQNIRTDHGHGPIVSSPITATEGMVAAVDDTAPDMVTDVAADAETGIITWTVSADDGGMDAVMYRGHAIVIPHVTGYLIRGGVSEDAMIDIGGVPAGSSSFQVPEALLQSLIDQGVPSVLVTVTALDGTNMTPSVPLVVELIPTRKPFVGEDGGPVYIVKLDRHGAMTPLTVDFEDFVAFTMAFNTDETHENWRVFVQADLNDDKMVNFEDFILFFGSYGKVAQGPAGKSLVTPSLGVNEAAELTLRLGSDRVVAGENVFVDVSLANVQALMGYGFVLHYDAEKFEFVEAMPAAEDLLMSSGGETPLFKGWSPESGQVHVMNAIANGSEVSGNGDIVRLVFRVLRDFEDDARFEIAEGLVFDPSQFANPLVGGVLDIQTTPTEFALLQNFPNPFNPETTIGYELAESADVTLQIYNVVGQVVRTLIASESQSIGRYQVRWDGMDDRGMPVSSGIYFYQLSAGKFQDVRKLMLLK